MIKYRFYISKFYAIVDDLEAVKMLLYSKNEYGGFVFPDRVVNYMVEDTVHTPISILSLLNQCQTDREVYYSDLRNNFLKSKTTKDLSLSLGFYGEESAEYLLNTLKNGYYSRFYLPKKSGGFREISVPDFELSLIQKKLSFILSLLYKPKRNAHGFIINKGIITNSLPHVRMKSVLNIDIKNFFPTISFSRLIGMFSMKPFFFPEQVKMTLAKICCHNNQLPQGAATSPVITNFICRKLDDKLLELSRKHKCRYSRYADDITFSFNSSLDKIELIENLRMVLLEEGFQINEQKVRIQNRNNRQQVTGVVVNEKVNVRRDFIRNLRAILHSWKVKGIKEAIRIYNRKYSRYKLIGIPDFKASVRGKIEYVGMVRGKDDGIYGKYLREFEILANQKTS